MLSLEDEALDAVLEIDDAEIAKDDGVYAIINWLKKLKMTSLLQSTKL